MDVNLRNFKDFLQIYNSLSELCFKSCVINFNSRSLDQTETKCVNECSGKFIKFNHRLMAIYAEYQQMLMEKRIKEAGEQVNQTIAENVAVQEGAASILSN